MSKKVPEVIFTAEAIMAVSRPPYLSFDNPSDLEKYIIEHAGEKLFVHIEPMAQVSEKIKMFAYYHRVILHCAVIGYTAAGWEGIDSVKADFLLRAELAKDHAKDPKGEWIPTILDKRSMTKARLHKFLEDCIFFIENTLQQNIPNSEDYKLFKETGKKFKAVNDTWL
jgi:hypothetical protein